MTVATGRLGAVVLDCADPAELARFWAAVLGRSAREDSPTWWELEAVDGEVSLAFQRVDRHRRPGRRRPQQLHIDVAVDDLDVAEQRVLALGAEPAGARHLGEGAPWRVYSDPAGHPFCLCACAAQSSARPAIGLEASA
jgi:catechol 2,3-dioxygenase-like lactoylglutathione lyase family enzyme